MTDVQIARLLSVAVSITGCWFFIFWLYRDYRVDRFRQEMFSLRDEFFDAAKDGRISFDHPIYGSLRTTMNGFIRFGHQMTLLRMLPLVIWMQNNTAARGLQEQIAREFEGQLETLSEDQRELVLEFRSRMRVIVLRQLLLGSSLFVATLVLPLLFFALSAKAAQLLAKSGGRVEAALSQTLDSAALEVGEHALA